MSTHVVVGAGPVGTAIARHLQARGDDVVVVTRSGSGPDLPGVRRVATDATDATRLTALAVGATAIHDAANPAYHRWATDWPPLHEALMTAAERTGAVLVGVGNLYGYGPVDGPLTEDLPLAATGTKGRVRADMWRDLAAAHASGRLRAVEVRGSDYVCPGQGSHLGDRMMPRLLAGRKVMVLPSADVPHTWTAVDDVARLAVTVADDERAWGRAWHVPSAAPRTQRQVVADLARVAGVPTPEVGEHPALLLRALGAVNPMVRELREVAYQLERPFVMDSTAAQRTFGLEPTPWGTTLERQVAAYRVAVPA